jgi:flagellar basal-body rod protein FlgB
VFVSWNNVLGVHEPALNTFARRSELLANNLANADTPNYKAVDVDFRQALAQAQSGAQDLGALRVTNTRHLQSDSAAEGGDVQYRTVQQASLDGNTVDPQVEKAEFMQNALRYQTSLEFLSHIFSGLRTAIRGD